MSQRRTVLVLAAAGALLAACSSSSAGTGTGSAPPAGSTTTGRSPTFHTGRTSSPETSQPVGTSPTVHSSQPARTTTGARGGPVPSGFEPSSVTFVSPSQGWVLGTAPCDHAPCTSVVRTTDGGHSWVGVPAPKAELGSPSVPQSAHVSLLRFATPTDGWAAGGALYSTHDGATSWHVQHVGASGSLIRSLATGGGHVYAETLLCSGACTEQVFESAIGSDDWHSVSAQVPEGSGGLVVTGSTWFLPSRSYVLRGSGTGQATHRPTPCSGLTLAAADATHLDAVCLGDGAAGSASYQLYGTTDGGAHWTKAGPSRREESDLGGVADNGQGVLMLAVASGDSELLRTTDDGTHLNRVPLNVAGGGIEWTDLGFTTSAQGIVVLNRKGLYVTHDSGASWSKVAF